MEESSSGSGPFAFLSRRRLLRAGLGCGGALLAGAGGAWYWALGGAPAVEGLERLSAHHHRTLRQLTRVMFPATAYPGLDLDALDLPGAFDAFLAGEPEQNVSDLRSALTLLELGPVVFDHRATTFSRLPVEEAEATFRDWMTGDDLLRRQASLAFRKFMNLVFHDRPEVWPRIGYPGPSLGAR